MRTRKIKKRVADRKVREKGQEGIRRRTEIGSKEKKEQGWMTKMTE